LRALKYCNSYYASTDAVDPRAPGLSTHEPDLIVFNDPTFDPARRIEIDRSVALDRMSRMRQLSTAERNFPSAKGSWIAQW
jgi:hypothetical protein